MRRPKPNRPDEVWTEKLHVVAIKEKVKISAHTCSKSTRRYPKMAGINTIVQHSDVLFTKRLTIILFINRYV